MEIAQALPRLRLSNGGVTALKLVALLAMVIDHVNAVFYARDLGIVVEAIGRIAMPIFAIVVGYNLARPGADHARSLNLLLLFGAFALPFHAWLFSHAWGWWPLNILYTFAVAVGCIRLLDAGRPQPAIALFFVGGAVVEYWWPGVSLVVAAFLYFRQPTWNRLACIVSALCCLCIVNGNLWALLAVPLVIAARVELPAMPRLRLAFWIFYPTHLGVFALLSLNL